MADTDPRPAGAGFTALPDLACRPFGGGVVAANDELFAERENLIKPGPPHYSSYTFGHKGQVYDGWETRRRREPGHDWALVRLGMPGVVRGVVVDTAFFKGNYPPEISVEGARGRGLPLAGRAGGRRLGDRWCRGRAVKGDAVNEFAVRTCAARHARPARPSTRTAASPGCACTARSCPIRGCSAPVRSTWPRWPTAATVAGCSNMFYSSPANLLSPGRPG